MAATGGERAHSKDFANARSGELSAHGPPAAALPGGQHTTATSTPPSKRNCPSSRAERTSTVVALDGDTRLVEQGRPVLGNVRGAAGRLEVGELLVGECVYDPAKT